MASTSKIPSSSKGSNKDRSSNFSKEETTKLTFLLQDYPLITSKKTDHASNAQKEMAWRSLAEKFNSDAIIHRTVKQLQQKFNNMKKSARMEMSAERNGRRLTGGGPPPPPPSDTTEWLNTIMGESISGLPAVFDSDATENTIIFSMPESNISTEIILMDTAADIKSQPQNYTQESLVVENEKNELTLQDMSEIHIEAEEDKGGIVFDSSTPQAMLRKPVSKQLLTPTSRKKKTFTPAETRKKIITHIDKKMEHLSHKQEREINISQYALEEHKQTLLLKKSLNDRTIELMQEKHVHYLQQQQELHVLEVDFKKKMHALLLEKARLEIEKIKQ